MKIDAPAPNEQQNATNETNVSGPIQRVFTLWFQAREGTCLDVPIDSCEDNSTKHWQQRPRFAIADSERVHESPVDVMEDVAALAKNYYASQNTDQT